MNRLGHIGFALLAGTGTSALLGLSFFPTVWLCAIAASFSTLPDIDLHWQSGHRGGTHSLAFMFAIGLAVGTTVLLAVACIFPHILPYIAPYFPSAAGIRISSSLAFAAGFAPVVIGIGSHLLADLLTYRGTPLLWPSDKKKYSLRMFKSDSAMNVIFGLTGFILFLALIFTLLPP